MKQQAKYLQEEGFCGTCAYFNKEPRCQGGICVYYPDKPQVKIDYGCEEYGISKEYENYWLDKEQQ